MIIKSTFRQVNGLEAHLMRSDTNERVDVRMDLFRGTPRDLNLALRLMDGISRSNSRTVRSFVHVVIAPGQPLNDQGLGVALAAIEAEFGIGSDAPRAVVQHTKGSRPKHFHAVYSVVDLQTGRAIKSHDNYAKDEFLSRTLELRLGERIVPGPRLSQNIDELRARGATKEADQLAVFQAEAERNSLSRHDRRQAERLDFDPSAMSEHVYNLYEMAGRDLHSFANLLEANGYHLCDGNKAVLVGADTSGFQTTLIRCLRREGKANGRPVDLREWHLGQTFLRLRPKTVERDAGLARARTGAVRELDAEWQRGIFEALVDADEGARLAFQTKRKKKREELERAERELHRATLKLRREEILELHSLRDEARRARVDRAFRAARLFDTPSMRRLAFTLAAMGVLMTGAGLTAALLAGGIAQLALPSMPRARQLAGAMKRERGTARRERERPPKQTDRRGRSESTRPLRRSTRFSFDEVTKGDRILAGLYAKSLLGTAQPPDRALVEKAATVLGADIVAGVTTIMERGSPLQIKRLLHWYNGVAMDRRGYAVDAALGRRTGQTVGVDCETCEGVHRTPKAGRTYGQKAPATRRKQPNRKTMRLSRSNDIER